MAGQGEIIITRTVPASVQARGTFISGLATGAYSATLKGIGCVVEGADATELKTAVQINGTALALFGATITAGQELQADVDGNLIVCVDDGLQCAIALEGGADGELRSVKIV